MEDFKKELRKNGEGYNDPTAYEAIMRADDEYERFKKMMGAIFRICELADFHVEERIILKDLRSGRVWR